MRLQFLGATGTVTGSKYLVEKDEVRILVDCGLFQGEKNLRLQNRDEFPVPPGDIQTVLLTHAHLDHSGYLPLLVRNGFRGEVYATPATEAFCRILLPDSGRLQEEEAHYANRAGYSKHHPARPLYTYDDAVNCLTAFDPVPFGKSLGLGGGLQFHFERAGHILGASMVMLKANDKKLLFTGDLGRPGDPVIFPPSPIESADYLVLESTYGDRLHKPVDWLSELEAVLLRTILRRGVVVIPAFSVGRSQTLLYGLYRLREAKRIPNVPIFLDSPMSEEAVRIFRRFQGEHRLSPEECAGTYDVAKYVRSSEESKALNNRKGPMIIVSASGMVTGGRVLHHIKERAPNPDNTILLTGFQANGTRGAALLGGTRTVKIHGELVAVNAEIASLDNLSAHADQGEILSWLSHFKRPPETTFITHGEPEAASALASAIEKKLGWKCHVPHYLEKVDLK